MIQATIYEAPSDSGRGSYEVQFYADGSAKCACPAYSFGHRGSCKHIERLRRAGKEFVSPPVTKVFRVTHGDDEVVLVYDDSFVKHLREIIETMGVQRSITVQRIA